MTAVCPSESSPEGAEVGARTAGTRGSGAAGTTGSISVAGVGESNADSVGGSIGGTAVVTVGQRYNRWSRQDSSDINTDDEGATIRRLTPLERLNLFSCFLHSDPDSVAFCVLATDEEYECDIALQIHFTLIQAFCFDNDINVVRVNDIERLADLVGADENGESKDAHCILVTSPSANPWKDPALDKLSLFCEESRSVYDWVPTITLPER